MDLKCPGCGASLKIQVGLISIVCPYCNTISLVQRDGLVTAGEKSFIMPFPTVFEVGKTFYAIPASSSNDKVLNKSVDYISEQEFDKLGNKDFIIKFYVYGQIRYNNDGGFWDDFFVRILDAKFDFDKNANYLIGENEGLIHFYKILKLDPVFGLQSFDINVGNNLNGFFVQEKGEFVIEGFGGSFPFSVYNSKTAKYINLLKNGKQTQLKAIGNEILQFEGV